MFFDSFNTKHIRISHALNAMRKYTELVGFIFYFIAIYHIATLEK